jgi:hypothetical protein
VLVNLSCAPSCPVCRGMQALLELRECVKERTAYAEEVGAAHEHLRSDAASRCPSWYLALGHNHKLIVPAGTPPGRCEDPDTASGEDRQVVWLGTIERCMLPVHSDTDSQPRGCNP